MADDMGFSDIGCYGGEIPTPNLDRLASRGLRFAQFYNTARCCPTRASLLTGLYSHQAGVGFMRANEGAPGYVGALNEQCVTVAEVLRAAGYRTLMSGKWHVGGEPMKRGFDHAFEFREGATSYFKPSDMYIDGERFAPPDDFYLTDAISDRAAAFVRTHGGGPQPFFLYVAYTAPHWPLHARPADIERHRGRYMCGWDALRQMRHERLKAMGLVDPKWPLAERDAKCPAWDAVDNKDEWDLRMAVYAAMVEAMDRGIGRIVEALDAVGCAENTLVMFLSDNGGCHVVPTGRGKADAAIGTAESFTGYDRPWANASNTPFALFKQYTHEGGIASPLVVAWPGVIRGGGEVTREVGHVIDLMPTCLDAAGAAYPTAFEGRAVTPVEGLSLRPVFEGRPRAGHDALFWEHAGSRAVRQGRWKLVSRREDNVWHLFDLEADRTETRDLAAEQPAKAKELAALWDAWAVRCHVLPKPEKKPKAKAKKPEA
jgi:arylsulfatase